MVQTSPHYAFTVACTSSSDGNTISLPCQKVLALIRSTKNSKPSNLGDGFKLITPGVEDLLSTVDTTGLAEQKRHTLSAICTLSNLPQYRLDPPRGGNQDALVIVTAKTEDTFVIESVQFLTPEEASQVKYSLLKLLHLAMHIHVLRPRTSPLQTCYGQVLVKQCRFSPCCNVLAMSMPQICSFGSRHAAMCLPQLYAVPMDVTKHK